MSIQSQQLHEKDVAVALTFDFDVVSNWIGSVQATPGFLSRGEFDRIGVPRVLALLSEFGASATFFTPGHTAASFPQMTDLVVSAGHEIGHHGWVHENPLSVDPDTERRLLERGITALEKAAGRRPTGYRSPAWENSAVTTDLLVEYEFEYDSSLMGGDYEPYWCRTGDVCSATEAFVVGTPVALVEVPVSWHLDDFVYFEFVAVGGSVWPGLQPPSTVLEIWKGEFDYLYKRVGKGLLTITMHPQVIGRGHRQEMLRAFLEYVTSFDGVRFTRVCDYVREWRAGREPTPAPGLC